MRRFTMDNSVDMTRKQIEDTKYKSGEIFLDICRSEYESEKNRVNTIDSKTNIVITLLSVFFVSITEVINFKTIFSYSVSNFVESIFPTILILTMLGAIVTSFISILCFLKVIFTSSYQCIDLEYFYNIDQLKYDKELYSITLAHFYIQATEINRNVNDKRIKIYKKGMIFLIVSIFLFTLYISLHSCL